MVVLVISFLFVVISSWVMLSMLKWLIWSVPDRFKVIVLVLIMLFDSTCMLFVVVMFVFFCTSRLSKMKSER